MTTVINLTTTPLSLLRNYVYIGRPSKWGNPYRIGMDGDRQEVLEKYKKYLKNHPELVKKARTQLKDKVLGCFCHPQACHGDILAAIANAPE